MIHYMVGKLAPNSSHLTRGLVKHVSGRGYFRTVPSQNGDKILISPPPLIVEPVDRCVQGIGRGRSFFVSSRNHGYYDEQIIEEIVSAFLFFGDGDGSFFYRP